MRISVFAHDANPSIDQPRLLRRSRHYCETEVAAGRAQPVNPSDIRQGIQLLAPHMRSVTEHRGSPESRGCITASESHLNADYRGHQCEVLWLAREYENRLDAHVAEGRKGTPYACAVIAARVKTILSQPSVVTA